MPIYEYKCKECDTIESVSHGMTETPELHCGICRNVLVKTFSFSDVAFKGEGFYSTSDSSI